MEIKFKQTGRNQYQIWTECRFSPGGVYVIANAVYDYNRGQFSCFHSGWQGRLIGHATTLEMCERMIQRSFRYGSYYSDQAPVFHFYDCGKVTFN